MYKKVLFIVVAIIIAILIIYICTYDKNKADVEKISTDKDLKEVTFNQEESVFNDGILGTLIIEKIGLRASIKEGSTSEVLKKYIGHIEGTSIYDGNVGLAAHNRGNGYSFFARLNELENEDEIIFKTVYGEKLYKVIDKKVILETDWQMLEDTEDNRLTLITCIKNKANQRLCVQAVQNKGKDDEIEEFNKNN